MDMGDTEDSAYSDQAALTERDRTATQPRSYLASSQLMAEAFRASDAIKALNADVFRAVSGAQAITEAFGVSGAMSVLNSDAFKAISGVQAIAQGFQNSDAIAALNSDLFKATGAAQIMSEALNASSAIQALNSDVFKVPNSAQIIAETFRASDAITALNSEVLNAVKPARAIADAFKTSGALTALSSDAFKASGAAKAMAETFRVAGPVSAASRASSPYTIRDVMGDLTVPSIAFDRLIQSPDALQADLAARLTEPEFDEARAQVADDPQALEAIESALASVAATDAGQESGGEDVVWEVTDADRVVALVFAFCMLLNLATWLYLTNKELFGYVVGTSGLLQGLVPIALAVRKRGRD